nr:PDDEXK nuclease domain-containing protein [Bacteroides hominis (ex Liu et al. 2022)]MDV6133684.1 PDDEXK nuclease domain-containing protein [Bacteroides hominis (ex Liu et al. 2022)]MDV6153136.1 PDDEXK nuclease domain-containing protein [Bacteroides hominis (ex Liu et al. 2022)]
MKKLFIYKGLELEANINGYATYELKRGEFQPEYIGKLNFYCSAVDDILCRAGDNQTIGLLLCQNKNRIMAEYALRDVHKPIGISDYELGKALPKDIKSGLPSIEELESKLSRELEDNTQSI